MPSTALYVEDANLSRAWARAFLGVMRPGSTEVTPLVVKVTGATAGEAPEDALIRQVLDEQLARHRMFSCETVAETIFPRSLWNPALGREKLFDRYLSIVAKLKSADAHNRYGMYFERLIAYGASRVNQLDHVIRTYQRGNHRRTALQASIFDPLTDHTHQPRRGFPCLQHVTFAPTPQKGLEVTGIYTTQYLFERAYGNYLGLYWLGQFIAHEMGLQMSGVTCVASIGLRDAKKTEVADLLSRLDTYLSTESIQR